MIRRYRAGDEHRICRIFQTAIHQLAREDYTPEQLDAWASRQADTDNWRQRCEQNRPFVKELDGQVVGFIEFDPDGHIGCTYVDPRYAGQGVMTEIMEAVKREAIKLGVAKLYAEVSQTARVFFERHKFVWVSDNLVNLHGVSIENFIMECDLSATTRNSGPIIDASRDPAG